jgi:cytoskeletal protein CcmA (bactofilin family)
VRARPRLKIVVWVVLAAVPALVAASLVIGQETRLGGKIRAGEEIVVSSGETVDGDLYAFGGSVRIEGTVEGDLVAMAGQVQVSGTVDGDAMVGSGDLDITGRVDGDVRVGAGQVTVGGTIEEDLFAGSGQATITSSGEVGEDFVFGTGRTTLDGRVEGDVLGGTGAYTRRGSVGGTEDVTIKRREERTAADRLLDALQRFVSLMAVAALLLWLIPRVLEGPADTLRRRPWLSLGVGVLGVAGSIVLVAAIVFVAVLVGVALGLLQLEDLVGITIFGTATTLTGLGFLLYLTLGFVAQAVVGVTLGRLALGADAARRWWGLALGLLVIVLISLIPVVGGFLGFVITVFGFGALILEYWPWRPSPQPAPTTTATRKTATRRKTTGRKTAARRKPQARRRPPQRG